MAAIEWHWGNCESDFLLALCPGEPSALIRMFLSTQDVLQAAPLSPLNNKHSHSPREISTVTKAGLKIRIRPLRAEDRPLLEEFFHTLSPRSIHFRFFVHLKRLSPEMLSKLMQFDDSRDVVLVATQTTKERDEVLGVFRLLCGPDGKSGEFSLIVGDPWQGMGVGARLFQYGLATAERRGIESVLGLVLPENTTMIALARKLGFKTKWDSDTGAYELRKDLILTPTHNAGVSQDET